MSEVLEVSLRTLRVTGTAIALALAVGVPLGAWLGISRRRGRTGLAVIVNTGMALPSTAVGLAVAYLVARQGPFGLALGCSVPAMVAGQVIIATPIVAGLTMAAIAAHPSELRLQAEAIGARGVRLAAVLLRESRVGVVAAVIAGYGAIASEVGSALVTGCNLRGTGHNTRLLTTAMVEQIRRGDYASAAMLGGVLMGIVLVLYTALTALQRRGAGERATVRRRRG